MTCCAESFGRGVLGITEKDRTFSVAKLFFAYGLGNALYFPFSVGASTILYNAKPEPERCFEIIERHRPTIFYGVPTAYAAMLALAERSQRKYDLSSLRLCSSAGEPLPGALYERWKARFGVEILDGIGSTEALHTFIANRPGRVRCRLERRDRPWLRGKDRRSGWPRDRAGRDRRSRHQGRIDL